MGWFSNNNKEETVPELPELPKTNDIPPGKGNLNVQGNSPSLPPLPNPPSYNQNNLNEPSDLPNPGAPVNNPAMNTTMLPPSSLPPANLQQSNFENPQPIQPAPSPLPNTLPNPLPPINNQNLEPRAIEMSNQPLSSPPIQKHQIRRMAPSRNIYPKNRESATEPIYIRLDKFQETASSFKEIKNKIFEIENLLNKTKEIREKEDKELEEWETELEVIKSKIESIDKNIFNKLG